MAATDAPGATPDALRKKQLIDDVVERSGIKKKYAKPVVEAMLAVLGEAVAAGTTMNLQPLGKVMVQRTNEKPSGRVTIVRIRQSTGGGQKPDKDPLASAAE
ncbi:MAG TPA: DNA-binding protein [Aliiroseovarius sp.]|nr:DNA-binding protein [Aliiroseovarius sp.]